MGIPAFHGGPRLCLGSKCSLLDTDLIGSGVIDDISEDFALTEASYLTIRILQEFPTIRLPPGYPVVPTGQEKQELTVFLKSAEGCKVVVS